MNSESLWLIKGRERIDNVMYNQHHKVMVMGFGGL